MTSETEFRSGVVAPVECLKEGWELIKGRYWLFLGICLVGMMIGNAFAIVLMGPMMCGIFLCFFQQMRGEEVSFERLFNGFDYFGQSVIAMLIQAIPAVLIILPAYFIMVVASLGISSAARSSREAEDTMAFAFTMTIFVIVLAVMLLSIVLGIFFMFTFPLIVDRKLSGVDAIKTSIKAARANFGGIIGLVLLNALLSFGGLLVCYVGAFLVMPITLAAQAIAYRRVFPEMLVTPLSSSPPPPPPPGSWAA